MPAYYEYGFQAEGPAWHRMGTDVEGFLDLDEALEESGLDWKVRCKPIAFKGGKLSDGKRKLIKVPNQIALVKDDGTNGPMKVLGIHKEGYQPIQNHKAFEILDYLTDKGAQFNSAGALKGERVVWVSAKMPETYKVLDDDFGQYFFFATSHDGSMAFQGGVTDIRIVCWNTLTYGINSRIGGNPFRSIRHTKNVEKYLDQAMKFWKQSMDNRVALQAEAERLFQIKLSQKKWEGAIETLFPLEEGASERKQTVIDEQRSSFYVCLEKEDLQNFVRTGWGLVQAAADYADHALPCRQTETWRENRLLETIGGAPLVRQAMKYVEAAAN